MRLLVALMMALAAPAAAQPQAALQPGSHTAVRVDPRIELMSMIQLLADYPLVTMYDSRYKDEAKAYFGPYRDLPAVTMFRQMAKTDFNFSTVPETFMALTPPPDLAQRRPFTKESIEGAGGKSQLDKFVAATRDFAKTTRFQQFFKQHRPFYDLLVSRSRPVVNQTVGRLEQYIGMPLGDTTVILGPLLHDGGFGSTYTNATGEPEVYAFIGPVAAKDGVADFGTPDRLVPLITHEFTHSVINPLTDRYSAEVARSASHFEPLREAMHKEGYGTWKQVVYESVIRAITTRLTAIHDGPAAGEAALNDELKRGYVYVPALVESLKTYEQSRQRYPTIADYYPVLLQVFDQAPPALPPAG